MDGVLATKEVKEHYPDIKIIILTTFDDDEFIYSALKYGASGYLLKGASTEELYEAIKVVVSRRFQDQPGISLVKSFKFSHKWPKPTLYCCR